MVDRNVYSTNVADRTWRIQCATSWVVIMRADEQDLVDRNVDSTKGADRTGRVRYEKGGRWETHMGWDRSYIPISMVQKKMQINCENSQ